MHYLIWYYLTKLISFLLQNYVAVVLSNNNFHKSLVVFDLGSRPLNDKFFFMEPLD